MQPVGHPRTRAEFGGDRCVHRRVERQPRHLVRLDEDVPHHLPRQRQLMNHFDDFGRFLDLVRARARRAEHALVISTIEGRGALDRELILNLRTGRSLRMPRARAKRVAWAHVTPDVLIGARSAEADDRVIPGHWEGDLVRHEALCDRAEVRDLRRCAVAAA